MLRRLSLNFHLNCHSLENENLQKKIPNANHRTNIKKNFVLFSFLSFLTSCYTMHFTRVSFSATYHTVQWHHIGLFGLMEFSDPVNLEEICPKDYWGAVRVRTNFLQGALKIIPITFKNWTHHDPFIGKLSIDVPIAFIGNFYSPEEVSVYCKIR